MEKYGKVFRTIRESKNMSLKEVAGDFVTPAQLSRFENGKSNLSVDTFFKCLQRMDVLQGEFSTFYNMYYQSEDVRVSIDLHKALQDRNGRYFEQKINEFQKKFESEGRKSDRVLIAVFHVMLNKCNSDKKISEVEKKVIADYLLSIDEWCLYEIWIFGNCIRSLSSQMINVLCAELISRTQFYHGIKENLRRIYGVLLAAVGILLDRGEERLAAKLIRSIEGFGIFEDDLFERLQMTFYKAQLKYLQGDLEAFGTMKKLLEMAQLLECYNLSQHIEDTISQLTDM